MHYEAEYQLNVVPAIDSACPQSVPMELPHMHLQMPFWLQRTAERAQSRAQASISDHISVRHETCRIETQDGFRVLKCEEIKEVFRLAHDG